MTPEQRERISKSLKRAYAEGRAVSPATNPKTRGKVIAALNSPKAVAKRAQTIKALYASGKLRAPMNDRKVAAKAAKTLKAIGHYERLAKAKRGVPRPNTTRIAIANAITERWRQGAYDARDRMEDRVYESHVEWLVLKGLKSLGFRYNPAVPVPPEHRTHVSGGRLYVRPDFYNARARLVVEIDGEFHKYNQTAKDRDAFKTRFFGTMGIRVIRFRNDEVVANPDTIIARVRAELEQSRNSTSWA